jgi:hypothetical protein
LRRMQETGKQKVLVKINHNCDHLNQSECNLVI